MGSELSKLALFVQENIQNRIAAKREYLEKINSDDPRVRAQARLDYLAKGASAFSNLNVHCGAYAPNRISLYDPLACSRLTITAKYLTQSPTLLLTYSPKE
jgi:hypothetical protein